MDETIGEMTTLISLGDAAEMTQGGEGPGTEDKRKEYA
jgi:hypothetical protein